MTGRERVTVADLDTAIEWLEDGYEGEDETLVALLKVAAYLRAERDGRIERANVHKIMRRHKVGAQMARKILERVK